MIMKSRSSKEKENRGVAGDGLSAVQLMIRRLNEVPAGTRLKFEVDIGPGIKVLPVIAYFDPVQFRESGGVSTSMMMEGIPDGMRRFFQE